MRRISFVVAAVATAGIVFAGTPVASAVDAVTAADRALAGSPRPPLTTERYYFLMADRFANGDSTNDTGGLDGDRSVTGFDPTGKGFYHGGDLAGVIDRLDYIKELGTTAIWLTPSFQNRPVQGSGADMSAGYHGYWVTDFTRIDPHLGTNAEMKELVDKAHANGMKVFFDIITNHTADVIDYRGGDHSYVGKADRPYTDAEGNVFDDRDYAGGDTFPRLDAATSFPYEPYFHTPEDARVKVPAWLNDPTMYHNRGDSTFQGESSEYGDFVGLDDLFTENPRVVRGMGEIYETWVDLGIDGFRIDTAKHVNVEFWQQFSPMVLRHAAALGNDDFFMFGEVYDADPRVMSTYTTAGRLQATLDFGFQTNAVSFAQGKGGTGLADLYADDDYYTDADSNAYQLPTFLGNHDMGRIGMMLDPANTPPDELMRRDRLAHALMYVTRGQPVVYYGDEQGPTGDGGDQDARQDMFASRVASYNDDPVIGGVGGSRDRYATKAPLYRHIAGLAKFRDAHPALADGAQVPRHAEDAAGVFAVSRIDATHRTEYLVAANNAEESRTVGLSTYTPNATLRSVFGGATPARTDGSGTVSVTVPPLSVAVWKADRPMPRRGHAPAFEFTAPAGGSLSGRAEIAVKPAENAHAEVTFAYRVAGNSRWHRLGADDNAPYRVFHDVTAFPADTRIEYRAVLEDASGNLTARGTTGVVSPSSPAGAVPERSGS